jgi:terminase, large subunit
VAIDSGGGNTEDVYQFVKRNRGRRWFAVKGSSSPGNPLVKKGSLSKKEKVRIWMVGTDTAKDEVFSFLNVDDPGSPGCCHFPNDDDRYGDAYIKQLCSERKIIRHKMGRSYSIYEKVSPSVRNEALDLRVYATAARAIILPNFDKWAERQSKKRLKPNPDEEPQPVVPEGEPESSAEGDPNPAPVEKETKPVKRGRKIKSFRSSRF